MAQSIRTYSFSCAISFERASTLSFIYLDFVASVKKLSRSFGIISVKIINKRTVEKRLIKVRSVSLKFNVHLGS